MPGSQNPPTRDTWGRGKYGSLERKQFFFYLLKLEKVAKQASFVHVLYIFFFFNLRPQRACYLLKIYGRVFLKRIKTCKSVLYKKFHQPVPRIGQFKGLYFSSGHFFPLNIKVMLVYYGKNMKNMERHMGEKKQRIFLLPLVTITHISVYFISGIFPHVQASSIVKAITYIWFYILTCLT